METRVKGCKELIDEVIKMGLCTLCGACVGGCPYLVHYKGRIALLDNCTIADGQCYRYCPRTCTDLDTISELVFGIPYGVDELGTFKKVLMARSTDPNIRKRAQYGGTITAILSLAITQGLIEAAVLSRTIADKSPAPFLAQSRQDILDCAGSNYMACPVLEALNRLPRDSERALAVVATPCQGLALTKMKKDPPQNRASIGNVKLVIGLFCTWALSSPEFHRFLSENIDLAHVVRFDIPPPPANRFDVYTLEGKVSLPLDAIRRYVMSTCAYCIDMTSEFADISVGSVEGIEGWNTVIVRTDVGARVIDMAVARAELELKELPVQNLVHLKEASLNKKRRALEAIIAKTGDRDDMLYLRLSQNVLDRLIG